MAGGIVVAFVMTLHDWFHLSTALLQLPPTLCALLQASRVALTLVGAGDDLLLQLRSPQEEIRRILLGRTLVVEMVPVSVVTVEGMEAMVMLVVKALVMVEAMVMVMVMVMVNALLMLEAVVEAMVQSVVPELPNPCLWAQVVALTFFFPARVVALLRFLQGLASHLQIHQRRGTVRVTLPIWAATFVALVGGLDHHLHMRAAWEWAFRVTFIIVTTVAVAFTDGRHFLERLRKLKKQHS